MAASLTETAGAGAEMQRPVILTGLALIGLMTWQLAPDGWRIVTLFGLGALMGLVLYHAAFGFSSAFRWMILHRDVSGVLPQLAMLAIATVLFAPTLAAGTAFGHAVGGAVAPVGVQVAAGAFLFGIGMQLGNGCGSGTLFTLGGGSTRMVVTLAAFIGGSFWASLHMHWWAETPSLPAIALGEVLGWTPAMLLQLPGALSDSPALGPGCAAPATAPAAVAAVADRRLAVPVGRRGAGCPELAIADRGGLPLVDHLGIHPDRGENRANIGLGSGWRVVLARRVHRKRAEQQPAAR